MPDLLTYGTISRPGTVQSTARVQLAPARFPTKDQGSANFQPCNQLRENVSLQQGLPACQWSTGCSKCRSSSTLSFMASGPGLDGCRGGAAQGAAAAQLSLSHPQNGLRTDKQDQALLQCCGIEEVLYLKCPKNHMALQLCTAHTARSCVAETLPCCWGANKPCIGETPQLFSPRPAESWAAHIPGICLATLDANPRTRRVTNRHEKVHL